jgi:hypothetical protein
VQWETNSAHNPHSLDVGHPAGDPGPSSNNNSNLDPDVFVAKTVDRNTKDMSSNPNDSEVQVSTQTNENAPSKNGNRKSFESAKLDAYLEKHIGKNEEGEKTCQTDTSDVGMEGSNDDENIIPLTTDEARHKALTSIGELFALYYNGNATNPANPYFSEHDENQKSHSDESSTSSGSSSTSVSSNGTSDAKSNVLSGQNPPDFSQVSTTNFSKNREQFADLKKNAGRSPGVFFHESLH